MFTSLDSSFYAYLVPMFVENQSIFEFSDYALSSLKIIIDNDFQVTTVNDGYITAHYFIRWKLSDYNDNTVINYFNKIADGQPHDFIFLIKKEK